MIRTTFICSALLAVALAGSVSAEVASNQPKNVPATREEVKDALNQLKYRKPRLAMPAPTEEELKVARERGSASGLGSGIINNARMRALHLPEELKTPQQPRPQLKPGEKDPNQLFDSAFSTELFWIVSRVNNCHYCLGHQEHKLLSVGVTDDRIAALDGDWEQFTPAEQAAFAFTRKLTFEPHRMGDEDIVQLKTHFNDAQVFEIVSLVSRYNSTNRWTDSLGIPQESHREFKTPTIAKYRSFPTTVAPVDLTKSQGKSAPATKAERPALEARAEVEEALKQSQKRAPRLPLTEDAAVRGTLTGDWAPSPLPNWVRLLMSNPKSGPAGVANYRTLAEKGRLKPVMRAQISWIAARQDRAWYALGQAQQRLKALGVSDDQMFALDTPEKSFSPAEQVVFEFTRKLTAEPQLITDADIESLRKHYSDSEVAEIVHRVTTAAYFDRITEAVGLPVE